MSYARTAVTRMTLDMSRPDLQRSETVTLGDTNRRWEVTLINGGAPFRLPPNWTSALTGIKPDGTGLLNGCSVVDGKIIYDFAAGAEIATCAGNYPVQFDIWDEVGDLVASPKVYVNVLEDARPHAEAESNGQYTQIGALIGRVNQTDADVDLLAETVLAQGTDITALKKKVTTAGSVTIPASEWSDITPYTAYMGLPSDTIQKGQVVMFIPMDDATKEAASKARLSVGIDQVRDAGGEFTDYVPFIRADGGTVPTVVLNLGYVVLRSGGESDAMVALIGVDAYGEGGSTASGVDEDAVKKIINRLLGNVANERQYSAANPPPYPVTSVNGKSGEVRLNASDVEARPSTWMPTADDVGADRVNTAKTLVNALANQTARDLANFYTKSQTLTKDEINALVSAIPKFKIEVVTYLPTSNIGDTTVYLVKSGDDDTNLYTEYIRAGDKWEKLGTQTVDLTGYATEAWVNNALADYIKIEDLDDIISAALGDAKIPRKLADLEGDAEHRTVTDLQIADIATAKSAAAKAVPRDKVSLAIHTDGLLYIFVDGAPVGQGIDVGAAIDADVIGTLEDDNNILLEGDLADGTYSIRYKSADGTVTAPVSLIVGLASGDNKADPTSSDWTEGSRLTTSGTLENYAGMSVTNYIEVAANDEVRFANFNVQRVQIANSSKANMSTAALSTLSGNSYIYSNYTADESGGYFKVKVASAGYIRLSGWVSSGQTKENVIITVNRVIPASL